MHFLYIPHTTFIANTCTSPSFMTGFLILNFMWIWTDSIDWCLIFSISLLAWSPQLLSVLFWYHWYPCLEHCHKWVIVKSIIQLAQINYVSYRCICINGLINFLYWDTAENSIVHPNVLNYHNSFPISGRAGCYCMYGALWNVQAVQGYC